MVCPSSARCKQGLPFNLPPTIGDQRARLGRRIDVHQTMPSVIPRNARRCRPTQLSFLHKAHTCDRHHIASAMAELVFCSSIIPHMRSFDVPPKLSPAHVGLFLRRSTGPPAARAPRAANTLPRHPVA
jgi:hypothetical protein